MAADNSYIQYGGSMMIFLEDEPMSFSTSAKLTVSLGTREISSKDSADWVSKSGTKFSWNMSSESLMNFGTTGNTHSLDVLYTYMLAKTPVEVAFASSTGTSPSWTIDSGAGKKKFTGLAIITSLDMNASDLESGSYSITLEGTDALTMA